MACSVFCRQETSNPVWKVTRKNKRVPQIPGERPGTLGTKEREQLNTNSMVRQASYTGFFLVYKSDKGWTRVQLESQQSKLWLLPSAFYLMIGDLNTTAFLHGTVCVNCIPDIARTKSYGYSRTNQLTQWDMVFLWFFAKILILSLIPTKQAS